MNLPKYPVPDPKKNYLLYFEVGLILSLATFISLFRWELPDDSVGNKIWNIPEKEMLQLEAITTTTHNSPKPAAPPDVMVPYNPPEDKIIEEQLDNLDIEFLPEEPLPVPTNNFQNEGYLSASAKHENPTLIGGIEKLQREIDYPTKAIEDNVEGRVIVKFWIDTEGFVHKPEIVKGVRHDLNNEALEAISRAKFLPARERGKPIPVEQIIFIMFKLD